MNANEDASCLDVIVKTGVGRHQRVIMLGGPFVNEAVRHVRRAMKINVYHQLRQLPAAMNRRANCSDCHWTGRRRHVTPVKPVPRRHSQQSRGSCEWSRDVVSCRSRDSSTV